MFQKYLQAGQFNTPPRSTASCAPGLQKRQITKLSVRVERRGAMTRAVRSSLYSTEKGSPQSNCTGSGKKLYDSARDREESTGLQDDVKDPALATADVSTKGREELHGQAICERPASERATLP